MKTKTLFQLLCVGCLLGAHVEAAQVQLRLLAENQAEVTIVDLLNSPLTSAATRRLSEYLEACLGASPIVVHSIPSLEHNPLIILGGAEISSVYNVSPPPEGSEEAYSLTTSLDSGPSVVVSAATEKGIARAAQRLVFLSQQTDGGLRIPMTEVTTKPWMASREYMLVNWSPDDVRTKFTNRMVNKKIDVVYRFGDDQIERYVQMFDQLGFTGVQLGESSVSWSMSGSKEAYQDRIRRIAQAARSIGQHVSYLFWAAEFNVGWIDPEMIYEPAPGKAAFEDPRIRAYFEKHYDHYAKMAPYVDLVIGHWFDSGRLKDLRDVIDYQKLLRQKMVEKNPHLDFAVNTWGRPEFFDALVEARMTDFILLEMSMPFAVSMEKRREFRHQAKENGFRVGVWGWYMTEYETDQLPNMHVNGHVMREYIQNMRSGAEPIFPATYWSEMEAYHLCNIYTMYQTAQLLWDPDRDPDELLREIAEAIWGPRDAPIMYEALKLIEEIRSGHSWETFSTRSPGHRIGTEDPASDARRARRSLSRLATLIPDPNFTPKLTLPVTRETLLELILPHLEQIRRFAEFRIEFEKLREMAANGASLESVRTKLAEVWKPIPEFDTWIGVNGQAEAWRQEKMIRSFCEELGIDPPVPTWKISRDRYRVLQKLQSEQRVYPEPRIVTAASIPRGSFNREYAKRLLEQLVAEGQLQRVGPERYQLVRWREVAFAVRLRLGLLDFGETAVGQ